MSKKKSITPESVLVESFHTLQDAVKVARKRGSGEELANIALTFMELAARLEGVEKTEKARVGFSHE